MKPLRPAVAAVILTALLAVPAHADHKRFGGFFVEPFFVPVPERPWPGRLRQQDGYPVALVRRRLRGIGFSGIGQFDVYPNAYGVTASDPGGVRVRLAIDRWTGDIMRARVIEAGPAVRPYRPPVVVDRAQPDTRITRREIAALGVPPLPRPAPERLTQTASVTPPSVADGVEPEKTLSPAVPGGDIVTSSINRADKVPEIDPIGQTTAPAVQADDIVTSSVDRPKPAPEIDPIGEPTPMPPSLPGVGADALPPEPEAPVEIAVIPEPLAVPNPAPAAEIAPPEPARPGYTPSVTALQGERFDPADARDPITVY